MARLPRDGDATGLGRMLELTVTALRLDPDPAVVSESPEHFADLHAARLSGREALGQGAARRRGSVLRCLMKTFTGRREAIRRNGC